jgi:hypothetical protein
MRTISPEKKLTQLDQEWLAANYDRGAAWARLRHSPYDRRLVEDYQVKAERCALVAERIIRYKKHFKI